MGRLNGKIAVVTGAGRGIGKETALFLANECAKIFVNDLGIFSDGSHFMKKDPRRTLCEIAEKEMVESDWQKRRTLSSSISIISSRSIISISETIVSRN